MQTCALILVSISPLLSVAMAQTGGPAVSILYSFEGIQDGAIPSSPIVALANGNLYGTTEDGGIRGLGCGENFRCGTFYQLTPPNSPGGAWTETIEDDFFGGFGYPFHPYGGLVAGPNGLLYGVAENVGDGIIYSLTPPAPGSGQPWGMRIVYNFVSRETPVHGIDGLAVGPGGVIYANAGTANNVGAIVQLQPPATPGGAWTPSYFQFRDDGSGGKNPTSSIVVSGILYVAMQNGGAFGAGAIVSLEPPASPDGAWVETVLYSFTGGADGANPDGLVNAGNSVLYGVTYSGGLTGCPSTATPDCGVIFQLSKVDGLQWNESVLYAFPPDGSYPDPSLPVITAGGVLYGTFNGPERCGYGGSCGSIYQLTPPAAPGDAWTEATVYTFPGETGGVIPEGPLTLGPDGFLYGRTLYGGSATCNLPNMITGCGTVFQFVP